MTGWTLRGRYRRTIALGDIESSEWWTGGAEVNFALYLKDGQTVPLHLKKAAGIWNSELEERLDRRRPKVPHPDAAFQRSVAPEQQ